MAEAVIFDVDGTLVDSVDLHARAWQDAFRQFGKETAYEEVRQQIGKGGDHLMPVFLSEEEIRKEGEAIEAYRKKIFTGKYMKQVKAFPRVRELFETLREKGLKVALASSAKGDELEKYKEIAGIKDLVEAETSSDDAESSKPEPDIFLAALGRLGGVGPEKVLAVGDTPYDAEAAGKAGIRTIGLLSGGFPEEQLDRAGCIAIFRDPEHLLEEGIGFIAGK